MARTTLASETGLSHATITTITADLVSQNILSEITTEPSNQKLRGRPAVKLGHKREAAYALLFEIDVNRARCSLIDYGGTLVDRIEFELGPDTFDDVRPAVYLAGIATKMRDAQSRRGEPHRSTSRLRCRAFSTGPEPG